jgi:hypothetical protein
LHDSSNDSEERAITATTDKLEANKKLARDYIDQVFNQHNPDKAANAGSAPGGGQRKGGP